MLEIFHFELFCHHLKKTIQFAVDTVDNLSNGSKRSRRQSSWKVEASFNSGVRGHQHSIFDISPLGIESTFWPSYTFTQPSLHCHHQKHVHTLEKSRDEECVQPVFFWFLYQNHIYVLSLAIFIIRGPLVVILIQNVFLERFSSQKFGHDTELPF